MALDYLRGARCHADLVIPPDNEADFCPRYGLNLILKDCDVGNKKFNCNIQSTELLRFRLSRRDAFILKEGVSNIMTRVDPPGVNSKDIKALPPTAMKRQISTLELNEYISDLDVVCNAMLSKSGTNLPELLRGSKLSVHLPGIQLTVINDALEVYAPILVAGVRNLDLFMGTESCGVVDICGTVDFSIYYYNTSVSYWEPLLEPFKMELIGASEVLKSNSSASDSIDEGFHFQLNIPAAVNLNVTLPFINNVISSLAQITNADSGEEVLYTDSNNLDLCSGFYVRMKNLTGFNVQYAAGNSPHYTEWQWFTANNNETVTTSVPAHRPYPGDDVRLEDYSILVSFGPFAPFKMSPTKQGNCNCTCIIYYRC